MRPGHPSPCPTWCRADHEADERRRLESVRATARQLAAEGLQVEPVLDTFRVHRVDVGQVVVRAGAAEEPAALRVELQQLEARPPLRRRQRQSRRAMDPGGLSTRGWTGLRAKSVEGER